MKVLAVRVSKGRILADGGVACSITQGIAVFIGMEKDDTQNALAPLAEKVVNLRIFENEEGKMHHSVKDKNFQILCIPNFTLCANTDRGRRPSFDNAMPPDEAKKLFDDFILLLRSHGVEVETGVFGAHMDIDLTLDGPVNIVLETK